MLRLSGHTVSIKTHPDHGGSTADQQRLNGAYESWCQASREKVGRGRPSEKAGPKDSTLRVPTQARPGDVPKSYQFWSQAVLLTYQGVQKDLAPGQTKTRPDRQTEGLRDRGTDRQRQRQTESFFFLAGLLVTGAS